MNPVVMAVPSPSTEDSETEGFSVEKVAIVLVTVLGVLAGCGGTLAWFVDSFLVIKEVSIRGDTTLRGPSGEVLDGRRGGHFEDYPIRIELDLGTEYGGDPSETTGGSLDVPSGQNCQLAEPFDCDGDTCRGAVRVDGPGLCAYSIHLESDPGGGVSSCHDRIFAPTPEQYDSFVEQWEDKEAGRYVKGVDAEALERCSREP